MFRTFGIKPKDTIEKRVMSAVRGKIASAQKEFEEGCTVLQDQHKVEVDLANQKLQKGEADLSDKLVDSIIGKFI